MAAKRALGKAHTFTGQYLERPELVTRGVYSITRNPLYFGVLQRCLRERYTLYTKRDTSMERYWEMPLRSPES